MSFSQCAVSYKLIFSLTCFPVWCSIVSDITLTVDYKADSFPGAGIQVGVLCQAGVVASVDTEDLSNGVLWPGVHLGVVVEPNVLAGWIGLRLT